MGVSGSLACVGGVARDWCVFQVSLLTFAGDQMSWIIAKLRCGEKREAGR